MRLRYPFQDKTEAMKIIGVDIFHSAEWNNTRVTYHYCDGRADIPLHARRSLYYFQRVLLILFNIFPSPRQPSAEYTAIIHEILEHGRCTTTMDRAQSTFDFQMTSDARALKIPEINDAQKLSHFCEFSRRNFRPSSIRTIIIIHGRSKLGLFETISLHGPAEVIRQRVCSSYTTRPRPLDPCRYSNRLPCPDDSRFDVNRLNVHRVRRRKPVDSRNRKNKKRSFFIVLKTWFCHKCSLNARNATSSALIRSTSNFVTPWGFAKCPL